MKIRPARSAQQVRDAADLMLALVRSNRNLYQDRPQMIEGYYRGSWFFADKPKVPAACRPPHGEVLIAYVGQTPAGTVATCRLDNLRCELKSMFIRHAFRGLGIATALCQAAIDIARQQNYTGVRLSTGERQPEALALYQKLGFEQVPPWETDPDGGVSYLEFRFTP